MDEEETELQNPFPAPPSHYTNYTAENLALLAVLRERTKPEPSAESLDASLEPLASTSVQKQTELLADQKDVPSFALTDLEPPRVDWILEDGYFDVFGDRWPLAETIPSLAELGGHQLYPEDRAADRRPALQSVLRSLLVTYSALTKSLLAPPPPPGSAAPPEWARHVEWITVLAQNLMAAANDLRPVQARVNLESMMRAQLAQRGAETAAIHAKCDELEAQLAQIRAETGAVSAAHRDVATGPVPPAKKPDAAPMQVVLTGAGPDAPYVSLPQLADTDTPLPPLTLDDMLRWAEEVG